MANFAALGLLTLLDPDIYLEFDVFWLFQLLLFKIFILETKNILISR